MINLDSRQGYQLKTHSSLQDKQSVIQKGGAPESYVVASPLVHPAGVTEPDEQPRLLGCAATTSRGQRRGIRGGGAASKAIRPHASTDPAGDAEDLCHWIRESERKGAGEEAYIHVPIGN